MSAVTAELWPYFLLIVAGYLPNEIWRALGLVLGFGYVTKAIFLPLSAVILAILAVALLVRRSRRILHNAGR